MASMKTRFSYILLIVFLAFLPDSLLQGQETRRKLNLPPMKTGMSVMPAISNQVKINFSLEGIQTFSINTLEGEFTKLSIQGFSSQSVIGSPELPSLNKLIEIPIGAPQAGPHISHKDECRDEPTERGDGSDSFRPRDLQN